MEDIHLLVYTKAVILLLSVFLLVCLSNVIIKVDHLIHQLLLNVLETILILVIFWLQLILKDNLRVSVFYFKTLAIVQNPLKGEQTWYVFKTNSILNLLGQLLQVQIILLFLIKMVREKELQWILLRLFFLLFSRSKNQFLTILVQFKMMSWLV